jgi:pseudouridine synthase
VTRKRAPKWLTAARASGQRPGDWIGRALTRAGALAPGKIQQAIQQGRLQLNGAVVTDELAPVRVGDRVELDGHPVELRARTIALMFHKPAGVIVAQNDPEGVGTVFDALDLPVELRPFGWHAIGRLDRMTTGLLLFTNDERLVAHVTSPETHLPKRYVADVGGVITDEQLALLGEGVSIDDGLAKAVSAERRGPREIAIVLTEGRYHQVRRMLNAVHLAVDSLKREAIGDVVLDIAPRSFRRLTDVEVTGGLRFALPLSQGPAGD